MSGTKRPDITPSGFNAENRHDITSVDPIVCPCCPVCGAETALIKKYREDGFVTNTYRCTACHVQYPVVRKTADAI